QGLGSRVELETDFGSFIVVSDRIEPLTGTVHRFGWNAENCVIGSLDADVNG
ncbi:hypothetical protein HPQ61_27010, partial [Acetobacteraceae bacterium]|nr:hypothetical protein [Acetobacteraceae bacterium]